MRTQRSLLIVVAAAVIIVGIAFVLNKDGRGTADMPAAPAKASGTMSLGADDAPITVIEYSDFQCPYCAIFANDIQPQIIEEFVDTGKIRFEWRNFPVFGEFSTLAAHGTFCADEQHAFWPYHDALYAKVGSLKQSDKNVDTLVQIAAELKLDSGQFRTCIEGQRYGPQVAAQFNEGRALGIVGTPTFMINGIKLVGAQPIEIWRMAVEELTEQ